MRKNRFLFLIALAMFIMLPFSVNAASVNNSDEFINALGGKDYAVLSADNSKITLQQDITLSEPLKILDGEYTLDLNGKKISDTNNFVGNGYGLIHIDSANLTIDDSVGSGGLYVNGDDMPIVARNGSELTIKRANIEANWTNLNIMHSKATIINGNFTSKTWDVLYSYGSDILIENGNFSGFGNCLLIMDSDIIIENGKFTAYGEKNSTALYMGITDTYEGKAEIWDGIFEANYIGFSASSTENYDVKIKGGTFTALNTENIDYNTSEFVSAGISMNLRDGVNSNKDATYLLEDGYTYFPTEIKNYELWGDNGNYFISATSNSVKVVSKDSLVNISYNLSNATSNGLTLGLANTEYKTTVIAGEGYELPEMVYILINDGSELSTSYYSYDKSTGELIIPAERVKGNITIVGEAIPKVNEVKYKVVFDANGGVFKNNIETIDIEDIINFDYDAFEKPTRKGYKFIGFYTKDGKSYLEVMLSEAGIEEDTTFYAKWELDEEVPKTLDNITSSIIMGTISLIGLVGATIYFRKRNKVRA